MTNTTMRPGKGDTTTTSTARLSGESLLAKTLRFALRPESDSLRGMYRHLLYPWYCAGIGAAGLGLHLLLARAAELTPLGSALAAAVWAGTIANTALYLLRKGRLPFEQHLDLARQWAQREAGHTRVVANAAAAFTVVAACASPASPAGLAAVLAAGILLVVACAARYWRYHRHHTIITRVDTVPEATDTAPTAEVAVVVPPDLHGRLTQRWHLVATSDGPLPQAELLEAKHTPYGVLGKVETAGQDVDKVRAVMPAIAGKLKIAAGQLEVETDDPTDGEPDPNLLWVRAISKQVMNTPVSLTDDPHRVVHRDGRTLIRLGRYVDGEGEVEWLLYDGKSMWSGYVGGVTGSGKSSLSECLVLGMLQTGVTYTIYVDPKDGQSSPRLQEHCHWFIGNDPKSWRALVNGLVTVIRERGKLLASRRSSGFTPTPELPGIAVILDEFYELPKAPDDPHLATDFAWVSRKGRSMGVTIVVLTQGYGLEDFGVDAIRANTTVANAIALKMRSNQSSIFARDFPRSNPAHLPDTEINPRNKGLAVSLMGRDMVFRTAYSGDDVAEELIAQARHTTAVAHLDAFTVDALDEGSDGLYAAKDSEDAAAATAADIAARTQRGQQLLAGEQLRTRQAVTPPDTNHGPGSNGGWTQPPELPATIVADINAAREARKNRPETDRAILSVLANGETRRADIDRLVDASRATIHRALRRLESEGHIEGSTEWGTWRLSNPK